MLNVSDACCRWCCCWEEVDKEAGRAFAGILQRCLFQPHVSTVQCSETKAKTLVWVRYMGWAGWVKKYQKPITRGHGGVTRMGWGNRGQQENRVGVTERLMDRERAWAWNKTGTAPTWQNRIRYQKEITKRGPSQLSNWECLSRSHRCLYKNTNLFLFS